MPKNPRTEHHPFKQESISAKQVGLDTLKWTRRSFCVAAIAVGLQAISMIPELAGEVETRKRKQIDEEVNGLPYYQALISLGVDYSSRLPRPKDLKLRGVEAIKGISRL